MPDRSRRLRIALVVIVGLALGAADATAQVSPGPLSRVHQHLEGIRHCRDCHGGDSLDSRCLDCHQALAWNIAQNLGLHAREGREGCAHCHPEHGGVDFALIDWGAGGREGFDHGRTGWPLDGAHARAECSKCHRPENRVRAVTLRRPEKSDDETWLGLPNDCVACHQDVHGARLGTDCAQCHTTTGFRDVARFDHARTGYPLRGKHATLACTACHEQGKFGTTQRANARLHLAPIAHADCNACHRDPHQGRFGATCARCHVESGFREVSSENFDHDRTRYPLRGAHVRVRCARCHDPAQGGFGEKPPFERCDSCHTDAHAGTATLAGRSVDCAECHAVGGFAPSTFDVNRHAATKFALEGKHAVATCNACHRRESVDLPRFGAAKFEMRPEAQSCRSCHVEAHGNQLLARSDGGACDACHTPSGWKPSTFTVARHDETRLPLHGAHASAPCSACHAPERPGLPAPRANFDRGTARVALRLDEKTCADCHYDPHRGRYARTGDAAGLGPCEACHTSTTFAPSSVGIDAHDEYGFRLEGAHRATPCIFCHEELDGRRRVPGDAHALVGEPPIEDVVLWNVPSACQDCHRPGGQP